MVETGLPDIGIPALDLCRRIIHPAPKPIGPRLKPAGARRQFLADKIKPGGAAGPAAADPREPHPAARPDAVLFHRLDHIFRAGRHMPTGAADERRKRVAVEIDRRKEQPLQDRRAGATIVDAVSHAFPDHHRFCPQDLAFGHEAGVLMTEKDAVKCERFARPGWWAVTVEARPDERLGTAILKLLLFRGRRWRRRLRIGRCGRWRRS